MSRRTYDVNYARVRLAIESYTRAYSIVEQYCREFRSLGRNGGKLREKFVPAITQHSFSKKQSALPLFFRTAGMQSVPLQLAAK